VQKPRTKIPPPLTAK